MHRSSLWQVFALAIFVLLSAHSRAADDSPVFRAGDRWSVVGDSISHSGSYHAWVYLYYLTRFPERPLDVTNVGIAGDTAAGGVKRLKWDVLPTRPTVTTLMFGMNDVGRGLYSAINTNLPDTQEKRRSALDTYRKNMRTLIDSLHQTGSRVVLLTPSPFDQTAELAVAKLTGVNDALGECAGILRELGRETGAAVVDLHAPMTRLNGQLHTTDPKFTLTGADRIHPAAPGHFVMAYLLLQAQHAPAEVARLTIDAKKSTVVVSANGSAEAVRRLGAKGIAFTWTAKALPFPIDPDVAPALAWVPFMADFNQEVLQVTGLEPGNYELRIDGTRMRAYSADDLARGVNLAELPQTPQYRQALEVLRLVKERRLHEQETTRNIALVEHQCAPPEDQPYTWASIRRHYDRRMDELRPVQPPTSNLLRIYNLYPAIKPKEAEHRATTDRLAVEAGRAAQPKAHKFELRFSDN
jgi:lysophospholipase L1-like esterase